MSITLIPHNNLWLDFFQKEIQALSKVLRNNLFEAYHIGATSMPHVHARPVLDIAIAAHTLDGILAFKDEFKKVGLILDQKLSIHDNSICFKRLDKNGEDELSHIFIYDKSDKNLNDILDFKDYLNSEEKVAKKYSEVKQESLNSFEHQVSVYEAAKKDFFETILKNLRH